MNNKNLLPDICEPENLSPNSGHIDVLLTNRGFADINPLLVGQYQCTPGHFYGPNIRCYYLLHYVVSGKGIFKVNNQTYNLSKGDIFVIRPGEEIAYSADLENPWQYRWIAFNCTQELLPECLKEDIIHAPEVEYIFRSAIYADRFSHAKEMYICSKLFELFAILSQRSSPKENKMDSYVQIAKNFIESNYNDPRFSISMLAEKLNLNRSYLSTIFKNIIGLSLQQYLQDFRLKEAINLLLHTEMKIENIAFSCGYSNGFHFSKMFRQKYGVSPSQYRKNPKAFMSDEDNENNDNDNNETKSSDAVY